MVREVEAITGSKELITDVITMVKSYYAAGKKWG
jgi:hypothetical protein